MNTVPQKPNVRVKFLDVACARRQFLGIESLVREASQSHDPRVITLALQVLVLQRQTADELLGGVA